MSTTLSATHSPTRTTPRLAGLKRAEALARAAARRAPTPTEAGAYLALARRLRRVRQAVARPCAD